MIGSTSYPHEGTTTTNARIMILFAIIVAGLLRSLRARMRSQRDVLCEQTLRRWNETDVLSAVVHELIGLDFFRSNKSQAGAEMLFRHGHCCMICLRKRKRKRKEQQHTNQNQQWRMEWWRQRHQRWCNERSIAQQYCTIWATHSQILAIPT